MIITCSECESSFEVDDSLIKETGSKVRCSKCSSIFVAYRQSSDAEIAEVSDEPQLGMDDQLESDSELDEDELDWDMEEDADDGLPDLETKTVEFGLDLDLEEEDDDSEAAEMVADMTEEPELDLSLDEEDDETEAVEEAGLETDESEFDLEFGLEDETAEEATRAKLDHVETADTDLPDLEMDFGDLDEAEDLVAPLEDSDLELDLELDSEEAETPVAEAATGSGETDELDLSDLEGLVDSDAQSEIEDVAVDDSGLDLDLDLDSEDAEPAELQDEADELELADLEGLVEPETELEAESSDVEAMEDDDIDMDFELETEEEADTIAAEFSEMADEADELDLSDLEDIVEPEPETTAEGISAAASDDLDLNLELDQEAQATAEEASIFPSADQQEADELDLSDLAGVLEPDEQPELAEGSPSEAEASDMDLELDFEVDDSAAEIPIDEDQDTSDPMVISDIEDLLETEEQSVADENIEELELELDGETETVSGQPLSAEGEPGEDEDDFLDIDTMLEDGEETAAADDGAEEISELDLEAVMDEASAEPELELDLDLVGELGEEEGSLDISESAEGDLEFELLDADEESGEFSEAEPAASAPKEMFAASTELGATTDDFSDEEFSETRDLYGQTDVEESVGADVSEPITPTKRRTRKPIIVIFLFLLLLLGALIVPQNLGIKIPYLSDIKIPYISDIKIPYLSDLQKSEVQDTVGNLKITPLGQTVVHKFIDNEKAGKLLAIKGKVRNEYDHPRSFIKIKAKLYQKGNALAKTVVVYCGNVLSDKQLSELEINTINKRLQNRFGDKRSNIKVKSGTTLPFLVIFSKLPANLDEYTVEVAGSSS